MSAKHRAWVNERLLAENNDTGVGEVVVARNRGGGRIDVGVFLVDRWCLGIINAFFLTAPNEDELQSFLQDLFGEDYEERPPAWARKFIEGAIDYARTLSFAPHRDYKKAAKVLGGIRSEDCKEDFEYGLDGQPFYVQGESHDDATAHRIIAKLRALKGDAFNYLLVSDPEEVAFANDEDDEDDDEGDLIDLRSVRAEQSGGGPACPDLLELIESLTSRMPERGPIEYDPDSSAVADRVLELVKNAAEGIEQASAGGSEIENLELGASMIAAALAGSILTEETREALVSHLAAEGVERVVQKAARDEFLHTLVKPVTKPEEGRYRQVVECRINKDKRLMIVYAELEFED